MKEKTLAGLVTRIALFYFTAATVCHTVCAQSEVRFRQVSGTLIVVSMTANDKGPFQFVLDTGADTTILDPSLAAQLSLAPLGHTQQTTLAGAQNLVVASLPALAVGPARVQNLPVMIQDLAGLRKMDPQIQGITGQDFLSHFNYLLDYRRHSIRIELDTEIEDAVDGDRVPFEGGGHRMIVAAPAQSVGRANLRLMLDSGANSVVLTGAASRQIALPVRGGALETTTSGQARTQVGRVRAFSVGSQQLHDVQVAVAPFAADERIGDGLLPAALFQALYVNNRESFVVLNPQAKKN
jgi:predicted aspartyl protease